MLEQKIMSDYKLALKDGRKEQASFLSYLRAQVKNRAIEKKEELSDEEVLAVIKKEAKRHEDAIEQFKKGQRPELAEKEEKELLVLKSYMPQQLTDEQIRALIEQAIKEAGALESKNMGKVIKLVMAKAGDQAQGSRISAMVKEQLGK